MIKDQREWADALREVALSPESPVKQADGKWVVADRQRTWKVIGPRITDAQLEKVKAVAVDVLTERDPQFDLDPAERYAAAIHGKVLKHSPAIRKGLAETLALLGSDPGSLTMATLGKPEAIASLAVREILTNADWLLWASLNDVLPILAEAAPSEFLDAIEAALNESPSPFTTLFAQESSGFGGRTYITGLLWGLEALAWSPDYVTRVAVILGDLAALDPGGNWGNRPAHSLTAIFLPWYPQTMADISRRKAAVTALIREQPGVGWRLLLGLLPHSHNATSGTYKPSWRRLIPEGWVDKVSDAEYVEQVENYSEMAIHLAATNPTWTVELIEHLPELPAPHNGAFLDQLGADEIVQRDDKARLPIWEALVSLVVEHRKFADADWAMPADYTEKVERLARRLAPVDPDLVARRVFSGRDWELYEDAGDDGGQEKLLREKRQRAAKSVFDAGGVKAVISLAGEVESPWQLGRSFAEVALAPADDSILPGGLLSNEQRLKDLANGYVIGRLLTHGWSWVDQQLAKGWSAVESTALLVALPFERQSWERAGRLLGNDAGLYWKSALVFRSGTEKDLVEVIPKLLDHGRPRAALECLARLQRRGSYLEPAVVVRALMEAPASRETAASLDAHSIQSLIEWLQEHPPADGKSLFQLEWNYLPILGDRHSTQPKTLFRMLSDSPDFYCEVIQACYRSENDKSADQSPTEEQRTIAQNAARLLHGWTLVPGTQLDGTFDGAAFTAWLAAVKAKCQASGHLRIGMHYVGQVLTYAAADPGGLWMAKAVAEALNERDAEDMRSGFTNKLYNRRGVHGYTAGRAERELAAQFYKRADDLDAQGFQRIAAALRDFAKSYEREAEQEARRDPFKE